MKCPKCGFESDEKKKDETPLVICECVNECTIRNLCACSKPHKHSYKCHSSCASPSVTNHDPKCIKVKQ